MFISDRHLSLRLVTIYIDRVISIITLYTYDKHLLLVRFLRFIGYYKPREVRCKYFGMLSLHHFCRFLYTNTPKKLPFQSSILPPQPVELRSIVAETLSAAKKSGFVPTIPSFKVNKWTRLAYAQFFACCLRSVCESFIFALFACARNFL